MPGRNHGCRRPTHDFTRDIIGTRNVPFLFLNQIGHGAFGSVWRARNLLSDSSETGIVAVKVLRKATSGTSHQVLQLRELLHHKAVAAHPHIASMYGALQDEENLYIAMDYCSGGTLLNLISKGRAFARNDAFVKGIFLQLIDALHYCHQKGIFHRDIKPANILMNRERNKAFLTDFGLSTTSTISKSFRTGTRSYMSPECLLRASGSYSCKRNDIWSLGVTLVNILTGHCPWVAASSSDDCYMAYIYKGSTYLRWRFPISQAAAAIICRMLHPDPEEVVDLVELRTLIQEVDTFFMTEVELSRADHAVNMQADEYFGRRPGPAASAPDNNPPSEGLPIYLILDTTSDELSGSEAWDTASEGSLADDEPRGPLRVRNVVPLVEDESVGDPGVACSRGEKTSTTPATATAPQSSPAPAPEPASDTDSAESFATPPETPQSTSESGGGLRMFFRITRPRKSCEKVTAGGPPQSAASPSGLAASLRRIFGYAS